MGTYSNNQGQPGSLNGTQMLNMSQSLFNSHHVGAQAMSMNNLNFYPVQGEACSPHQFDDSRPHFAQSMKNVTAKAQSFAGVFGSDEFSHTKPAPSNSMLNSSFLQGFACRRGLENSNLRV